MWIIAFIYCSYFNRELVDAAVLLMMVIDNLLTLLPLFLHCVDHCPYLTKPFPITLIYCYIIPNIRFVRDRTFANFIFKMDNGQTVKGNTFPLLVTFILVNYFYSTRYLLLTGKLQEKIEMARMEGV